MCLRSLNSAVFLSSCRDTGVPCPYSTRSSSVVYFINLESAVYVAIVFRMGIN
jgi:hypothetical protein